MRQHRRLRLAGGARGVLDHRRLLGLHGRQGCPPRRRHTEVQPVVKGDGLAQRRALRQDRLQQSPVVLRSHLPGIHDTGGIRLLKYVAQFACRTSRTDRDQHQSGERSAELHEQPFRAVRRPQRDMFSGLEFLEQALRRGFRYGQKLCVIPAALLTGFAVFEQ